MCYFTIYRLNKRYDLGAMDKFEYAGAYRQIEIVCIGGRWYAFDCHTYSDLLYPVNEV
jgi:hypothetical protein